jgi:hypothetical protein
MTEQDIYQISKAWIEKDHENSAVDWIKLMAADLHRRFEYQKELVKESDSLPLVSVSSIRAYVAGMNNDQRHNFFSLISEDYCKECGCDEIKYGKCHCWNDE